MGIINLAGMDPIDNDKASNTDHAAPGREWFIGAYVTREIKNDLKREADAEHRSLTQQLLHILTERYQEKENTK